MEDINNYVVPMESENCYFAPKSFEELLNYEQECEPVPSLLFAIADGTTFEHCFKITLDAFEEYLYYDDGADFELTMGKNYTEAWLKFQNELNKSVD